MSRSITVVSSTAALKSTRDNELAGRSTITVQPIRSRPGAGGAGGKSTWQNLRWNVDGKSTDGWFSATDVTVTKGAQDPSDTNDPRVSMREEDKKLAISIETTVSKSGDMGMFIKEVNAQWQKECKEKNNSTPKVILGHNKVIHDLLSLRYGDNCPNVDLRGTERADPVIRIKCELDARFSDKHPVAALRGQPKTLVYDYTRPCTNREGKPDYRLARVEITEEEALSRPKESYSVETESVNGFPVTRYYEPLCDRNAYKFLSRGCIIRSMRFYISDACNSNMGFSSAIRAQKLIVEPCAGGGFEDETDERITSMALPGQSGDAPVAQPAATPAAAPAQPVVDAPVAQPTSAPPADAALTEDQLLANAMKQLGLGTAAQ